jgi:hypothetical protein
MASLFFDGCRQSTVSRLAKSARTYGRRICKRHGKWALRKIIEEVRCDQRLIDVCYGGGSEVDVEIRFDEMFDEDSLNHQHFTTFLKYVKLRVVDGPRASDQKDILLQTRLPWGPSDSLPVSSPGRNPSVSTELADCLVWKRSAAHAGQQRVPTFSSVLCFRAYRFYIREFICMFFPMVRCE